MSDVLDTLLGQDVDAEVAKKISEIIDEGTLNAEDLDDRAVEAIKEFSSSDALKILEQFLKSDLTHVNNKSAFLCGAMKTFRAKSKDPALAAAAASVGGPNEEKVKELLERTGYTLDITTGQRKYGGPPPGWEGLPPGCGEEKFCSQIFIGKLPKDVFEDELVPMFEEFGTIYEFRIMVDANSGSTKGFAFCQFTTKEAAQAAVKATDQKELKGRKLGVVLSPPNNRLFLGSIPKSKSKQQIIDEISTKVECLSDVIVYPDIVDKSKNRGFAFLEFNTHKDASLARRILGARNMQIFGSSNLPIDWAEAQPEIDDETMAKVKVVYVKNITAETTEEKLEELFKQYGELEKVKKIKDYAFINFKERDDAVRAIEELNNQELQGHKIDVSLAKPQVGDRKGMKKTFTPGFGGNDGRGRGRGGPGMRGGRGGYGGYGYGYDEGYGYEPYFAGPPRGRGGPRGGPPMRGRAPMRGGPGMRGGPPMRGPMGPMRGGPGMRGPMRGGPMRGMRGGPIRGGPGMRGGPMRGGPGMRGGPRGGPRGAMGAPKRKVEGGGPPAKKAGGWTPAPIAQQPIKQEYGYAPVKQESWYQDDYNGQQW
jgi:RNA recognition motif-containing protein